MAGADASGRAVALAGRPRVLVMAAACSSTASTSCTRRHRSRLKRAWRRRRSAPGAPSYSLIYCPVAPSPRRAMLDAPALGRLDLPVMIMPMPVPASPALRRSSRTSAWRTPRCSQRSSSTRSPTRGARRLQQRDGDDGSRTGAFRRVAEICLCRRPRGDGMPLACRANVRRMHLRRASRDPRRFLRSRHDAAAGSGGADVAWVLARQGTRTSSSSSSWWTLRSHAHVGGSRGRRRRRRSRLLRDIAEVGPAGTRPADDPRRRPRRVLVPARRRVPTAWALRWPSIQWPPATGPAIPQPAGSAPRLDHRRIEAILASRPRAR
jgi:hypothetical protein